jgi:hypothetical protein
MDPTAGVLPYARYGETPDDIVATIETLRPALRQGLNIFSVGGIMFGAFRAVHAIKRPQVKDEWYVCSAIKCWTYKESDCEN